jgi:hypothetical protein
MKHFLLMARNAILLCLCATDGLPQAAETGKAEGELGHYRLALAFPGALSSRANLI